MTRREYFLTPFAFLMLCVLNNMCLMAQDRDVSERLLSAIRATSAREAAGIHALLFFKAPKRDLRLWKSHAHLNIALRAAWEPVRRSVGEQAKNRPRVQPGVHRPKKPSTAALYRFVGFLEGRLPVGLPKWWEVSLLKTRAHKPDNFFFPTPKPWPYKRTEAGVSATRVKVSVSTAFLLLSKSRQRSERNSMLRVPSLNKRSSLNLEISRIV